MNTIHPTNGYPLFIRLKKATQETIAGKYILPTDKSNLHVDNFNRPFEQINCSQIFCTIKKESLICGGFHAK